MAFIDRDELRKALWALSSLEAKGGSRAWAITAVLGRLAAAPVVSCEGCKHWRRDLEMEWGTARRQCGRGDGQGPGTWTPPGFGCVLFERRDDD